MTPPPDGESPPASAASAAPPDAAQLQLALLRSATLGDYDIFGELGRGGMATVYLAHDLSLDRKVAIKVMSAALLAGDGVERFRREARTAASLSHPNIIPIYAVRQSDRLLSAGGAARRPPRATANDSSVGDHRGGRHRHAVMRCA